MHYIERRRLRKDTGRRSDSYNGLLFPPEQEQFDTGFRRCNENYQKFTYRH